MKKVFYTVWCDKEGFPVKYIDPGTTYVKMFSGPFGDPGEASQEFQISVPSGYEPYYLETAQFQGKVRAFAELCRQKRSVIGGFRGGGG